MYVQKTELNDNDIQRKKDEDAEARSSNYLFSEQVKEIGFSGR